MKTTTMTVMDLTSQEMPETDAIRAILSAIPNQMGINLCSVEALTWTRQDDGQLVSLTVHSIPEGR